MVNALTIQSSNKIHNLHHTFYEPKQPIIASLLVAHGMTEHSGRYHDFAQFLADQGIAVLTYDHLGHGQTVNNSEELGFFNTDNPMQMLLKDVIKMSQALQEYVSQATKYQQGTKHQQAAQQPTAAENEPVNAAIPHFIMGHSMGSFIVRNVLKHHSSAFAGAILMGTGDKDPLVKLIRPLTGLLNKKAPTNRLEWISNTMSKVLNIKVKEKSASPFAWISKSQDNLAAYENDPLCGFCFTNNGYHTLFEIIDGAVNRPWYNSLAKEFPLLVISGQNDPVGNMGKGIDNLVARLNTHGLDKVSKTLYQDMRHEILNEADKQQVYQDIANWLLTSLAGKQQ